MQKRQLSELKMQASLAGIEFKDENVAETKKKKIEDNIKDPLKDFPNDVTYCVARDCDSKIRLSQKLKNRSIEHQWDDYRKECCLGNYGIVAKRCSVNDVLWGRYLQVIEAGLTLTLDQVKAMVEFDIVRRQLYPVDYKGDGTETPPSEYVAELQKDGEYIKILQKLDGLTQRMNTSSQSRSV